MHCEFCAAEREVSADGLRCEACGAPSPLADELERRVDERIAERLRAWQSEGLLPRRVARALFARLDEEAQRTREERLAAAEAAAERARALVAAQREPAGDASTSAAPRASNAPREDASAPPAAASHGTRTPPAAAAAAHDELRPAPAATAPPSAEAAGDGEALFRSDDEPAVGGSLAAFTELDALADDAVAQGDDSRGPSRLGEHIGWFVGVLLVLAGSVYGVREAWRTLGSVARHAVVASALLAYHGGFTGLARLLAPRSEGAARVLSAVAVGLLPMVFASLAAMTAEHPAAGLGCAALFAAVSWRTLRAAGARFGLAERAPGALVAALLPSLLAALPLARWSGDAPGRLVAPLVGVACVAWAGRPRGPEGPPLGPVLAAVYGAAALGVLAVVGAPDVDDVAAWVLPGSGIAGACVLWCATLAATLAEVFRRDALRARWPRAAPALEVSLLAALAACAAGTGYVALAGPSENTPAPLGAALATLAALVCAGAFARATARHPGATHPASLGAALAALLAARFASPAEPAWWFAGAAAGPALGLALTRWPRAPEPVARSLERWAWALGPACVALSAWLDATPSQRAPLAAAGLLAVVAFGAGGFARRSLHYFGGAMALAALWLRAPDGDAAAVARALLAACVAFGLVGLGYDALERRRAAAALEPSAPRALPFDDLSLASALGGALLLGLATPYPAPSLLAAVRAPTAARLAALAPLGPLALAGVLLLARAQRDRSRAVSVAGALALGAAGLRCFGASEPGAGALALGALALLLALLAAPRGPLDAHDAPEPSSPPLGRAVFGALPLPFSAGPRALLFDGFALASAVYVALLGVATARWLGAFDEPSRGGFVRGLALAVAASAAWFLSPSLRWLRGNGRAATLALVGALATLAAVANRVRRPLPPGAVALRLALVGAALWLGAHALRRYGPALARRTRAPEREAARYALVPAFGVGALAAVCALDALLVGAGDPTRTLRVPAALFFLAAGALVALLARDARSPRALGLAALLAAPGAMALAAQRALLGEPLEPLAALGSPWVLARTAAAARAQGWLDPLAYLPAGESEPGLWSAGLAGLGLWALALAALALVDARGAPALAPVSRWLRREPDDTAGRDALVTAATLVGLALVLASFAYASPLGALGAGLAGAALTAAGARRAGPPLATLAAAAGLHALAQRGPQVPSWAGPSLAALALAASSLLAFAAPTRAKRGPRAVLALLSVAALAYAFADGAPTNPLATGAGVALGALDAWQTGAWMPRATTALTLAVAALADASLATGLARAARRTPALAALEPRAAAALRRALLLALAAGVTSALALVAREPATRAAWEAARDDASHTLAAPVVLLHASGGLLALGAALAALVAHAVARLVARPTHAAPLSRAAQQARDTALVTTGALTALAANLPRAGLGADPPWLLRATLAALVLALAQSAHAAWREASARHVYLVQLGCVAAYASVRAARGGAVDPALDALAALLFGFVLVGVTVAARRAGLPPVAAATRRFAALLPVAGALLVPSAASASTAGLAALAAGLYSALAIAERSRAFGALAGLAGNLALLYAALSQGLDGFEVYLAPVGLFALTLGQLFRASLGRGARNAARVAGGLLLYLPAATSTALQLGDAATGAYALVFGAACLLGIGAGALLRIRAYLVLGALFLALDVGVNLAYAGLRDHRVGFAVLSLTGLAILGAMVLATLRREAVQRALARLRGSLRSWD